MRILLTSGHCQKLDSLFPETVLAVRRLGQADTDAVIKHFCRLDEFDRYTRFFAAASETGIDSIVRRFDWSRTLAVGAFDSHRLIGIAELGWDEGKPPTTAEIAMSVDRKFRNLGLASWLVEEVFDLGRLYGVEKVFATWIGGNDAVGRIMRNIGARAWADGSTWRGEASLDAMPLPPVMDP